ncbi:MAG: IspD/TarI family cytidylyltransferase [Candidatus Goldiibacteriota bacterium]|jgi:2-C-methyl-D-erythritol 4-phosphate cytidylyltransferase
MKNVAVIAAAGSGKRFGKKTPKQFIKVNGREILALAIDDFERAEEICAIVIVAAPEYMWRAAALVKKYGYSKVKAVISGGEERFSSVYNAVCFLKKYMPDNVLVHDGARPRAGAGIIKRIVKGLKTSKAVVPVNRIYGTVKEVKNGIISSTLKRENLRTSHTPQGFNFREMSKLYDIKKLKKLRPTDDAAVFEEAGYKVRCIEDEVENIKVTVKKDMAKIRHGEHK